MLPSGLFFFEDLVPFATCGLSGRAPMSKCIGNINLRIDSVRKLQAYRPSSGFLSTYDLVAITSARPPATGIVVAFPSPLNSFGFLLSDGFEFFDHNPCSHRVCLWTWVDEFALEVYVVEE
jgi:hypothetical protein